MMLVRRSESLVERLPSAAESCSFRVLNLTHRESSRSCLSLFLCSCRKGRFLFACFRQCISTTLHGPQQEVGVARRHPGGCVAHHFARVTSSITPVATCPEVTAEVDPAEAQRVNRWASWTRKATARLATPSRFSPVSTDRHYAQHDTRGHHRGCSCGSAPFGRSCGSHWGGESSREAFVDRPEGGQSQTQRPHPRPDRVYHTVFGTSQEEAGVG